jgi:cyclophilin family peptidyl-prolyl cis-trans isomerase
VHAIRNVCYPSRILIFALFLAGCGKGGVPASISTEGPTAAEMDDAHPTVVMRTSLGEMTIELDVEHAPITVQNFLDYANSKRYDGTIFHQVDAGYMALGGGYDRELHPQRAEFGIRNEAHNGQKNVRGTIAMAREADAIDSATNQFFLNLADNSQLDHKDRTPAGYGYCVFGRVTAGEDVLDRISAVAVSTREDFASMPVEPVVIESIRRSR